MLPTHIKAVFFDAVGTLIHPTLGAPRVYAEYAGRLGVDVSEATVRERMTAAYLAEERADERAGWVTSERREAERWRRVVAASLPDVGDTDKCFGDLFAHFGRAEAWTVDPEAGRVFAGLADRGLVLGMRSNYDARLHSVVAGIPDLAAVRDRVVVSSLVGVRKPGLAFFDAVRETAGGLAPAEIAFVGDDLGNDYDGATAAGMFAVLIDERDRHPGTRRIRRLSELFN